MFSLFIRIVRCVYIVDVTRIREYNDKFTTNFYIFPLSPDSSAHSITISTINAIDYGVHAHIDHKCEFIYF